MLPDPLLLPTSGQFLCKWLIQGLPVTSCDCGIPCFPLILPPLASQGSKLLIMEFALIATTSSSSDCFYYNIFFSSSGDAFYLEICFPGIAITSRAASASRWG